MKIKRTVLGPTLVAAVAVLSGGWLLQRGVVQQGEGVGNSRLFDEVVQYISTRYVDEHPSAELYQKAVDGLLRELGDPHTSFLTAEQYRNMRIQMGGDYGGLGIEIGVRDGWITIISPLPNSPGEAAGLLPGDRIIEVEGESTRGWTSDDAVKVLRGPRGTPVNIRVARIGVDEPIAFRVVREEIHTTSVLYSYLTDGGVGVVRLRTFGENAVEELNQSIEALRRQGMQRLVLDLRENPGGILDQGIAISDMFLKRGDVIAETRYRDPRQNERYRASQGERFP
ncbi:MAG: S41 family peptidase, partial [Longimicrobiaceae bacterium]